MKSKRAVKYSQFFRRPQCRNPDGLSSGPAPRLNKIYRQNASSGVVLLGGVQAIKLEFGSEQKLFDAITTTVFYLEGAIHHSLKNLSWYIINTGTTPYGNAGILCLKYRQGRGRRHWTNRWGKVTHPPYLKLRNKAGVSCRMGLENNMCRKKAVKFPTMLFKTSLTTTQWNYLAHSALKAMIGHCLLCKLI